MRLVTFSVGSTSLHVGVLCDTYAVDLTAAYAADGRALSGGMRQLLEEGAPALEFAATAAASGLWRVELAAIKLCAPIYDPEKIICVGMNYADHCTEQNFPIPKVPLLFGKFANTISAPGDPIPYDTQITSQLDFEVELVIVVGKAGRCIPASAALEHIAGYTVANDVSARDIQLKENGGNWMCGKTIDGYAPIGPAIVTRDELGEATDLDLRCLVNGETMQSSNTRQFVHTPCAVIAHASRYMTLKPGDLIFTGTPGGVGCFRKPPLWLKDGDVVTCEIDRIGAITNTVTAVAPVSKL